MSPTHQVGARISKQAESIFPPVEMPGEGFVCGEAGMMAL